MTLAVFRHTLATWHAIAGSAEYAAAAYRSRPPVHPARSAGLAIPRPGANRVIRDGQRAQPVRGRPSSPGLRIPACHAGGHRAAEFVRSLISRAARRWVGQHGRQTAELPRRVPRRSGPDGPSGPAARSSRGAASPALASPVLASPVPVPGRRRPGRPRPGGQVPGRPGRPSGPPRSGGDAGQQPSPGGRAGPGPSAGPDRTRPGCPGTRWRTRAGRPRDWPTAGRWNRCCTGSGRPA